MAYTVFQSGSTLQVADTSGTLTTLTMPSGISLDTVNTPRFTVFGRYVVVVNTPSRPITVDGNLVVRPLTPLPPRSIPTVAGAAGGSLSGTYNGIRQTFRILDIDGNVIAESDYGQPSGSVTISGQYLKVSNLDLSPDSVTESRIYRPTTNGSVLFPWISLSGNTATSIQDDLADAGLSLLTAPTLGSAPDLTLIAEWRGRLWGVSRTEIDDLRWTESELMYSWPDSNDLPIPRIGSDSRGITALVARSESLGVGRRNILWQMVGTSNADFQAVKVSENCGILSQESVKVFNDVAYFLWFDGVYAWDNSGVHCISDGKVRNWFASDTYFNRGRYQYSFARIDPNRHKYQLFLCSAGSSTTDRWVEYDLDDKTWWGPHKTGAFTPTAALICPDANDVLVPTIGSSSGFLWQDRDTRTDGSSTAIDFDVDTAFSDANTPDIEKYFGELSMMGKAQTSGTMSVTPKVGYFNASAQTPTMSYDMTKGRQRLRRVGTGKAMSLNFRHQTAGENVELYGFECEYHELGRR